MNNRIITVGLLTALATSCSVHEMDQRDSYPSSDQVFYAQMEKPVGDGQTKVYVDDDLMVLWHADDRVSIFNKYTYNQEYRFTGKTGANSGSFKKVPNDDFVTGNALDLVYAVYPYQESTEISNQGVLSVDLPATQTYAENSFGIGANTMVSCSAGNELMFKNLCGYLMLKLYGDDVTVTSISLKGNNGEPLAGTATVNASIDSTPSLAFGSDASKEISLTFNTPVKLGTTAEIATAFWIVVPPTVFSKGFTLTVKDNRNGVFEKSTTKSFEISRNKLARMSALEIESTIPFSPSSLKDFAKEFVKGLDVWEATVGTVESDGMHLISHGTAWENAHFIPIVPNPNCEYLSNQGNQYDPKYTPWVLNVAGQEISSSQAWEIAIRGLMNLVTAEGEAFLDDMTDRNKAYTLADNGSLNQAIPTPSPANQWGKHPWLESIYDGYDGLTYNGQLVTEVDVNFMVKVGAWHVVRSFINVGSNTPIGLIGNYQEFGTSSRTLNLEGYEGYIAPMRELLILMRIYKYLLDNNIDENVYSAIKNQKFDFDLYGIDVSSVPFPRAVDLGLSVKWASCNLGASKQQEYGDYYAWGEKDPKDNYTWVTYNWCKESNNTITKYCYNSSNGYNGFTDNKTVLDLEDDAARANWGGTWRMPTDAEWMELKNNCNWTWTSQFGVNGSLVTASNGNSIFLPAAGFRTNRSLDYVRSDGYYWSSSLAMDNPSCAWYLSFNSTGIFSYSGNRYYGLSIRPVYAE